MSEGGAPPGRRAAARRAWYADGLRFACQPDCGKCCTRHGDYDYVYLEEDDVIRLAAHFELSVTEFTERWTKIDEGHTVLKMDAPACPFLDGVRCTVYEARPSQCATFPFWPENLKSRAAWEELSTFCPGIGKGDFVPLSVIRESLRGRQSSLKRLAGAIAFALALSACGGGGAPAPDAAAGTQKAGGTLVIGSTVDADAWNEYVSQQTLAINLLHRIYARLGQEQGDAREHPPSFTPVLAESWEFSPDRLSLTVKLKDASWSDGTPLTASDVRYTWTAQKSPEVGWTGASNKERIVDVAAADPRTVVFRFDRAYPEMLADAMEGGIVPEHVFSKVPFADWRTHDWSQDKISSGPFVLSAWRPGEEIELAKNPKYAGAGRPLVDKVVVRVVPDMGNLISQLSAGTIDILDGIPPQDAKRVAETQGVKLLPYENPLFDYVGWNGAKKPFDDPDVRRALTLAIDRKAIVEDLLYGYGRISTGPLLSTWWAADPGLTAWPYDPDEARRILAAKGFTAAKPLSFELTTNAGNRVREAVTLKIQEQLGRIGVKVTPRTYEMKAFRERNVAGKFDAYVAGWRFNGKLDLSSIFGGKALPPAGSNVVSYRSAEADKLLAAIGAAPDWQSAKAAYAAFARQIHQDQPYTFLYEGKRIAACGPRVRDLAIDVPSDPLARLESVWLAH